VRHRLLNNEGVDKWHRADAARTSLIIMLYERAGRVGCAVDERAALIDMMEKGNVAGAVAATNHHLSAIEERLMIEAPPEKLAIECHILFAAAE
jgi:DNA-binding GntR family transcriptional regulator